MKVKTKTNNESDHGRLPFPPTLMLQLADTRKFTGAYRPRSHLYQLGEKSLSSSFEISFSRSISLARASH